MTQRRLRLGAPLSVAREQFTGDLSPNWPACFTAWPSG
jgi:hypothetical protein